MKFWTAFFLFCCAHAHLRLSANSTLKALDHNKILCPVLAAMINGGDLKYDNDGNVELAQIYGGLMDGIGVSWSLAKFQAWGITDFDQANKDSGLVRDRCLPGFTLSGAECVAARQVDLIFDSEPSEGYKRWFNPWKMNGKQVLEHGISTGTRGGANNVPDPDLCDGEFPCEARFKKFYEGTADENGRIYRKNLMKMVCLARKIGDRGGEYSYSSGTITPPGGDDVVVPAREWQMKAAVSGWLAAFGRTDDNGEIYLTLDDARSMLLEGKYPNGWQKRDWGCISTGCPGTSTSFLHDANQEVDCDVGEDDPWWGDAGITVATGATCGFQSCSDGTCVSGLCICGRSDSMIGMSYNGGKCVEQEHNTCKYFGESCNVIAATNPEAAGNPASSSHLIAQVV